MTTTAIQTPPQSKAPPKISLRANAWIAIPIGALIIALAMNSYLLLDYVHVFSAILWTGTDIFMGFVLGPILRSVSLNTRKEIISWLMPKMVFYMATMSAVTTTAGYFLASKSGLLVFSPPFGYWIMAAVAIVVIMLIQGLGVLLPTNLRIYFELGKSQPDFQKIGRLMRRYVIVVASQAIAQFVIIFVMAHLATGIPGLFY